MMSQSALGMYVRKSVSGGEGSRGKGPGACCVLEQW